MINWFKRYEEELSIIGILLGVFLFFYTIFAFDYSQLTHYSYIGSLIDKRHKEDCSPMYDDRNNYIGESCTDTYTVAMLVNGKVLTENVSYNTFTVLIPNTTVEYSYDLGRLGFKHNLQIVTQAGI